MLTCFPSVDPAGSNQLAWLEFAKDLRTFGINISVSDFLEQRSSEAQKNQEIDLVDFLFDSNSKEQRAP